MNHIGPVPVTILPWNYRPLPPENPMVVLGLHLLGFFEGCVGPGDTNSPRCGAQMQSTQLSTISLYIIVSQILTALGK